MSLHWPCAIHRCCYTFFCCCNFSEHRNPVTRAVSITPPGVRVITVTGRLLRLNSSQAETCLPSLSSCLSLRQLNPYQSLNGFLKGAVGRSSVLVGWGKEQAWQWGPTRGKTSAWSTGTEMGNPGILVRSIHTHAFVQH